MKVGEVSGKLGGMQYWLVKSEPSSYSIDDLKVDKRTAWTGVRNYQARNFMRDEMRVGDQVLFYHSNADPAGVAGIAKVVSTPYPDPTAFDKKSDYYDEKSKKENPRWLLVDIGFVKKFKEVIPLSDLRKEKMLSRMRLLEPGQRLSVMPVTKEEFEHIISMTT